MTNQPLTLKLCKHSQRFFDRLVGRPHHSSNPEVDDIQRVESEISQVVMDPIRQLLTRKRRNPRFVLWPPSTYFGAYHQTLRIRMKRPLDDLVGHVGTVKVARIDVIDPCVNCLSQNSYRSVHIARRSVHAGAGKLHGAIAHSPKT